MTRNRNRTIWKAVLRIVALFLFYIFLLTFTGYAVMARSEGMIDHDRLLTFTADYFGWLVFFTFKLAGLIASTTNLINTHYFLISIVLTAILYTATTKLFLKLVERLD